MRPQVRGVSPSPDAATLAQEMLAMEDVMREILGETIPDGHGAEVTESGRTLCGAGSDVKGPLARFPTAVELASCPRNIRGGTWHTHVTQNELRNPHNSLPDTANVIFGEISVSAVVGTQSVEVVMAAEDTQAGIDAFQNAIGLEVQSPNDVVDAIIGGRISDPTDARKRVRKQMGSLFDRHRVNFSNLDSRLDSSGIPAMSPVSIEMHEAKHYSMIRQRDHVIPTKSPRDPRAFKQGCRTRTQAIKRAAPDVDVAGTAASTVVSEVVRRAVFAANHTARSIRR